MKDTLYEKSDPLVVEEEDIDLSIGGYDCVGIAPVDEDEYNVYGMYDEDGRREQFYTGIERMCSGNEILDMLETEDLKREFVKKFL